MLNTSQKTILLNFGNQVFKEILEKASSDPVFNLTVGSTQSPGNEAANLAKILLKKEGDNGAAFELFGSHLASWLLPLVNIDSRNSKLRKAQCQQYLLIGLDNDHKEKWKMFLKSLSVEEKGADILFQFIFFKGYEKFLVLRNSMFCKKESVNAAALQFSKEEEKILRYVAGYIPFTLKKRYKRRQKTPLGKAVSSIIDSWTLKADDDGNYDSLYSYTLSWTEKINRGGLMVVNDEFYQFIKHVESVARTVLNKSFMISYCGEDLRDVLLKKFLKHELIDKSWCSLTHNVDNESLKDAIKLAILKKWISIRARSFVNAWLQAVKRKAGRRSEISSKSEPSLRKTLYHSKK